MHLGSCIGLGLLQDLLHGVSLLVQLLFGGIVPTLADLARVVQIEVEQLEIGEHVFVVLLLGHLDDLVAIPIVVGIDFPVRVCFPELVQSGIIPDRLLVGEHAEHVIIVCGTVVTTAPCLGAHEEHQQTKSQESLHSPYV